MKLSQYRVGDAARIVYELNDTMSELMVRVQIRRAGEDSRWVTVYESDTTSEKNGPIYVRSRALEVFEALMVAGYHPTVCPYRGTIELDNL